MRLVRSPSHVCSRIGIALLVMMAAWIGSIIVITLVFTVSSLSSGAGSVDLFSMFSNLWFLLALNDIPLYAIAVPIFLAILRTIPDGPAEPPRPAGKPFHAGWFFLVLAFCFGATYLLSYATSFINEAISFTGNLPGGSGDIDTMLDGGAFLPQLIFIAIVPALGEEFVFRYMLRKKLRGAGDKIYIFLSALCFALFHANFLQVFYAFVVGAVFAWVYVQTGKIWLPMILHFCINFFAIISPYITANEVAEIVVFIILIALMALAVVLFFVFFKRVNRSFQPPSEAGWPFKPPRGSLPWRPPEAPQPEWGQPPIVYWPRRHQPWQQQPQQNAYPGGYAYPPQPAYNQPPMQPWQQPAVQPWQQPVQRQPYVYHRPVQGQPPYGQPAYQRPPAYPQPAPQAWQQPWQQQQSPYQPRPYLPPHQYAQPPAGPWPSAPNVYQPVYTKPRGAVSLCLGNVGMILYLVLTGLGVVITMFS